MALPNFFNENLNRTFPFVDKTAGIGTPSPFNSLASLLTLPDAAIVDCGFIMGPEAGFIEGVHNVYLFRIIVESPLIYFEFASDAPALAGIFLTFVRNINQGKYVSEFLDSDIPNQNSASISNSGAVDCDEPFWSGYLVTGDLSIWSGIAFGKYPNFNSSICRVEPALIQNMSKNQVVSFNLVNADRTRALNPVGCPQNQWAFQTGGNFVNKECLQGDIQLRPGYNLLINQIEINNTLQLAPSINAGRGEPCGQVKLFPTETPPVGATNNLLDGDFYCYEVFRTVNGIQGPNLTIYPGNGVAIIGEQEENRLIVDINLASLSICQYSQISQSI